MEIKDASVAELEAELERRRKAQSSAPKPVENPDWSRVARMAREYVEEGIETERMPKDHDHAIFEAAMQTVYGPGFWTWCNAQRWAER